MDEKKYYLWLLLTLGVGSRAAVRLVRATGSAKAVWEDPSDELMKTAAIKPAVMDKLRCERDLNEAEEIISWCADRGVGLLTPDMDEYPRSLLCIMDFPMVLFYKGTIPDFNSRFCCGVVGTRKMTEYGKKTAYDMGWGLANGGAVVVSGLALGIDGMAMAGAQSAGGITVGVLGCGIDVVYPKEHKELFARTLEKGAIITEYPPGTPPKGEHFPVRNRIISGLSQAAVIVEADERSGALITARHAIHQGRTVYAVPGNVDEINAAGCNRLISDGAEVATCANDILMKFEFLYPHSVRLAKKSPGIAKVAAAVARVVSSADPKSRYQGDGVYGGRKKKSTKNAAPKPVEIPEEVKKKVTEKTEKLRCVHIDMLGDTERAIYDMMVPDTPMLPDEIGGDKYSISEVLTAMTLLEIAGAVEAGAGGYYIRCSEDDDLLESGTDK